MKRADAIPFSRDDVSLIASLKTSSETATKVLDEHTVILKSIDRSIGDINQTFDKRFQDMEARKIDRTEANRVQTDNLDVHVRLDERLTMLEKVHNELLATMRAFRWMFGILSFFLAMIFVPLFAAWIGAGHPF